MITGRRVALALVLVIVASCGPGCSGNSQATENSPAVQQRTAQLERFKARPVRPARKLGR